MRRPTPLLLLSLFVAAGSPASAQVPSWVNEILAAAQLPVVTAEARNEGALNDEIRAVLDAMKSANVPAHEATAVIDTARSVRRQHGPVDNLGAFVQSQLAAGKRGRTLAAAIRAEHARVGKGNPGRGNAKNQGKSDAARDSVRGNREDSASRGRPAAGEQKGNRGRGNPVRPDR